MGEDKHGIRAKKQEACKENVYSFVSLVVVVSFIDDTIVFSIFVVFVVFVVVVSF